MIELPYNKSNIVVLALSQTHNPATIVTNINEFKNNKDIYNKRKKKKEVISVYTARHTHWILYQKANCNLNSQ